MIQSIHIAILIVSVLYTIMSFGLLCYWHRRRDADPDIVSDEFYRLTYPKAECAAYVFAMYALVFGVSVPFMASEGIVRLLVLLVVCPVIALLLWYYMPQILGTTNDHRFFFLNQDGKTIPVKMDTILVKGPTEKLPALSVYSDKDNIPYLCACVQTGKNPCWIISKTSYVVLQKLLENEISIYDAVCYMNRVWVVKGDRNPSNNRVNCESLPDYMLPEKDVFMMAEKNEFYQVLVAFYEKYAGSEDETSKKHQKASLLSNRRKAILKEEE